MEDDAGHLEARQDGQSMEEVVGGGRQAFPNDQLGQEEIGGLRWVSVGVLGCGDERDPFGRQL